MYLCIYQKETAHLLLYICEAYLVHTVCTNNPGVVDCRLVLMQIGCCVDRDAVVVSVADGVTSLFCGFVIFSVLGYMAFVTGRPVSEVTDSGE